MSLLNFMLSSQRSLIVGCQFQFTMLPLGTKLTLLMLIQGLLSESIEPSPYSVDSHLQWINFNAFSAQPTALNAVDSAPQAGPLCNMFYEEGEVQEQPVLLDLAVSAAAHAHDSLSIPCLSHLRERTHLGISLCIGKNGKRGSGILY